MPEDKEMLEERQKVRFKILKWMYDNTVGKERMPDQYTFSSENVAGYLQLPEHVVFSALHYLDGEGLVEQRAGSWTGGSYQLKHHGVREVEHAIRYPERPTEHFMLSVVQHFHATVGVVQNGPDTTSNVEQRTE
jgi:hypothetical protein